MDLLLTTQERDRFAAWLEHEAATAKGLIEQMERIQLSEPRLQEMLEVAGAVLRRHRLFFAENQPVVRSTGDGLLYQLKVRTTAAESAALTDEVLLEMVERDLDHPGLSFSFIPVQ